MRWWLIIWSWLSCPALAASGPDTLVVLYTANTNGNLRACDCGETPLGGLAIRKMLMDSIRAGTAHVVAVDAGDVIEQFGFRREQDSVALLLYEKMGYDAVNLGDNEFAHGKGFFDHRIRSASISWIGSNLADTSGAPLARPWRMVDVEGLRIGITGFISREAMAAHPAAMANLVSLTDENDALRQSLDHLRDTDVIVVLSHAGYDEDLLIAGRYPDIDVIVGAHSQVEIDEVFQIGSVTIVQAGGNGTHLGVLTLKIEDGNVTPIENVLRPLVPGMPEDPDINRIILRFQKP